MDTQVFPPLRWFDADEVEHVTCWTVQGQHRHSIVLGQLQIETPEKPALVLL